MAIYAGGRVRISISDCFSMKAAIVGGLFVRMASGAGNFLGSGFVGRALYVCVAIHAGEHAAMNGILKRLRVDVQTDLLSILFVAEAGVTVAGKAIICGGFGSLLGGAGR